MTFWRTAVDFFWGTESLLLLLMVLAIFLLLHFFLREDRRGLFNTIGFYLVCLFGQFVSGLFHAAELLRAAEIMREVFVIGAGIAVIRLWGLLIFRKILPSLKLTPPRITEDIFVIIAYVAWFMVRLRYAGLDLSGILATSALITAVIAFAMQDTLGNILGGLALQLDNSIEVGDWIKVDDIAGKVVDIRWRSTLVETRNWETVVFPNSQLMKNKFVVLGRRTDQPVQWRRWVWFNVGLDTPPPKVINVIEDVIRHTDISNVATNPPPNCVLMEVSEKGYGRYALRYWLTDLAPDDPTDSLVRWHIMAALQRAGLKLAMDERGIHLTKENEKYEDALHQREIQLRLKTLRQVELFSSMTETELKSLAERLRFAPFVRGNLITRQGDQQSHGLYIIIRGDAEVFLTSAGGERRMVNVLRKGDFFGEMALLTGAPRRASVLAKTDTECYRLDKEAFQEILQARPAIAEEVSHMLALRSAQLDSAMQDINAVASRPDISQSRNEILATIRRFFSLNN
ncbi:MAG: mechanosensitive ion channel family protein [Sideroxyarcus sp.]|nr:mechanosensitive ion channel family protein [Sideroxyarcus sp.]